ncbi:type I restriction endonuclease [Clostridioides difficile]
MDFNEQLKQFSMKIEKLKGNLKTEEATKTSLVLPFFQLLGYDIFDPFEFVPEFVADVGTKKGEKVDYAIMQNNEPIMIIEVKSCDTELNTKHINQLFRYFSVTKAKFGVLTNGIVYRFYSDLEETNKMDDAPFLELNLLNIKESLIPELKRFKKETFDIKGILDSASELKYSAMIKKVLAEQLSEPSDQFIRAILSKGVYTGVKTQSVIDKFREIIKISFNEYINELINDKFKTVMDMSSESTATNSKSNINFNSDLNSKKDKNYEFSAEELQLLDYISTLFNVDDEVIYKKTDKYLAIQLGNNVRRWLCRVYLKQKEKVFLLHKFDGAEYECEYYFEEAWQLGQIKELIAGVAQLCIDSK